MKEKKLQTLLDPRKRFLFVLSLFSSILIVNYALLKCMNYLEEIIFERIIESDNRQIWVENKAKGDYTKGINSIILITEVEYNHNYIHCRR
ncbi:MAG: hypothetical protein ACFFAN_19895 [Promethearchaeota archaeon]